VTELIERGLITEATTTTCYVLGSKIHAAERGHRTEWDGRVTIIPMTYDTFVRRAEKRMLGLRDKLKDVPFLKERGLDSEAFLQAPQADTADLLSPA
jgi:hypothetical protein